MIVTAHHTAHHMQLLETWGFLILVISISYIDCFSILKAYTENTELEFQPVFVKPIKSRYREELSLRYTTQHGALSTLDDWEAEDAQSLTSAIYHENPCHFGFLVGKIDAGVADKEGPTDIVIY